MSVILFGVLKEAERMDTRSAEQSAENTWLYTCSFHAALRIGSHVSTSKINNRFLTTQNVCGTLRQLFIMIITKSVGIVKGSTNY